MLVPISRLQTKQLALGYWLLYTQYIMYTYTKEERLDSPDTFSPIYVSCRPYFTVLKMKNKMEKNVHMCYSKTHFFSPPHVLFMKLVIVIVIACTYMYIHTYIHIVPRLRLFTFIQLLF